MQNPKRKQCCTGGPQNARMHVGLRLKRLMRAQGVTTSEMADYCHVSRGAVSNWFATGRITKPNLAAAAARLGVTLEDLIVGNAGERGSKLRPAAEPPAFALSQTEQALVLAFREQMEKLGLQDDHPWCRQAILLARDIQSLKPAERQAAFAAAVTAIAEARDRLHQAASAAPAGTPSAPSVKTPTRKRAPNA